MKDYVKINECILNEWKRSYVNNNQSKYPNCTNLGDYFAPDGIMYKGELKEEIRKYENGVSLFRWKREPSKKENEMWANAPLRVLFLTKDQNTCDDVAWDVRSESFRYPQKEYKDYLDTKNIFYRNIAYSLYGIMSTSANSMVSYENIEDNKVVQLLERIIFARINCKKEVGYSSCSNSTLKDAIYNDNDSKFLKRQILNLDADIFVCCGYSNKVEESGNIMLNFLNTIGYNFKQLEEKSMGGWIYYDDENNRNKLAINSYHPSYPGFDYNGLITAYCKFLKTHHDFMKSHRE